MTGAGPTRVCHVCATTLDSHYFSNLGRGLHAHAVSVDAVSLSEPKIPGWVREVGGDYLYLNARRRASYPRAVVQLSSWLRAKRIDILQTHLFDGAVVGLAAARLAGIPLSILTRHHTSEMLMIGTAVHAAVDRMATASADRIVGLSHAVKRHMVEQEGAPAEKIDVIYQGFDFATLAADDDDRRRVRAELGLEPYFVVGCVARFFKTKGHEYLLKAARALVPEIPNLRILLLGSGDRTFIDALVREQGLGNRVIFGGYRDDVPACMRAMDVVVHPSLTEAFCQTVVEALAAGAPLVSTNVAAAPEVVTDGVDGYLVPAADPDAIAAAVLRVFRDPARSLQMAEAGRRSVTERFTIDKMVDGQLECYRRWLPSAAGVSVSTGTGHWV